MHISRLAVNRPVTILMVILIVVLLGFVSLGNLGIDLFPEMNLPVAVVVTSYDGAGPEEIETLVTKPVEEAIASVSGIEDITSQTREGSSMVQASFSWGTDMDYAALKMREKIGMISGYLPDGVNDPLVFQFDPSLMPINILTFNGSQGQEELKKIAEDTIKTRLERLEGVASVSVSGGREREIGVKLDMTKLQGYGITPDSVTGALAAQNLNSPGGSVDQAGYEYLVRTMGEFQSVKDVENVLVTIPGGGSVRLSEIADVSDSYSDSSTYNYMNSQPSVAVVIQKQSGTNTVKVATRIENEVEKIKEELPKGTSLISVMDQSQYIKRSINNVTKNAIIGAILAVLIIYLFLRNMSSTLIIGVAIPISIIATFILVHFGGLTLNLMSLGGLALGIGMLVDNAIVVLENIYRHRQLGTNRINSAVNGATEVANAITASTLTTLAVFLPIVYVEGLASQLFREMAMTVSFSLLASLLVSLTLVPMLASKFIRKINGKKKDENIGVKKRILIKSGSWQEKINNLYKRILSWCLKHRIKTVLIATLFLIASIALIPTIGAEFIPSMDQGEFSIDFELPKGTALQETKEMGQKLEEIIASYEEVKYLYLAVGQSEQDMQMDSGGQSHVGLMYVTLNDVKERKKSTDQIVEELRQKFKQIPGVDAKITVGDGMSMGGSTSPVNIEIRGDDFDVLESIGEEITSIVESVQGTREISFSMEEGRPELRLMVKRDKAASYGLTPAQIASAVRTSISGKVATLYRTNGDEINVRVEAMDKDKKDIEALKSLNIDTPYGTKIPLSQVADFDIVKGPVQIIRDNQVRSANVSADITGRDLKSVMQDVTSQMNKLELPAGYTVEYGGEQKEMQEAFGDLALALILAIILVYMIMAAQFESLMHPFVIMFSMPLALVGAVFGLFITGRTFNVPAFIGIIMLAGIVVNNAIVMVDYINRLRRNGRERKEAILEAGPVRLRPILMTALTTVLAMVPLAVGIGEGSEAQAPMATVVVGGLLVSTFLTLVVIPVMYTLIDDFGSWVKRKISRIVSKDETISN